MRYVFTTTYEIVGEGVSIATEHYAEVNAAKQARWNYGDALGAVGYRPNHSGGVQSYFFKEVPAGWRKVGREGERIECRPNKGTKIGKAVLQEIAALPHMPDASSLAKRFGYNPDGWVMDGSKIYFPTSLDVAFPAARYFLRLPRQEGDGFEPDEAMLWALPESEFMKALDVHNAEARRRKEAA